MPVVRRLNSRHARRPNRHYFYRIRPCRVAPSPGGAKCTLATSRPARRPNRHYFYRIWPPAATRRFGWPQWARRDSSAPPGLCKREEEGGVGLRIPGAMPAGCYVRALQARPSSPLLFTPSLCHFATVSPRLSGTQALAQECAKFRYEWTKFREESTMFRKVSHSFGKFRQVSQQRHESTDERR